MSNERPLSHKQLQALELMLAGHSQRKVGQMVGSQRRTVAKWLKSPKFLAALEEHRIARRQQAAAALDAAVPAAIAKMIRVMNDPKAQPSTQLRAANAILDRAGIMRVTAHEVTAKQDLVTLSPTEYAAAKVDEVREDIAQMRREGKATGIAALHRLEGEFVEAHNAAAREAAEAEAADADDAQALQQMKAIIQSLPQAAVDQLREVIDECVAPPKLTIIDGG